jgi:hypothetical protein
MIKLVDSLPKFKSKICSLVDTHNARMKLHKNRNSFFFNEIEAA